MNMLYVGKKGTPMFHLFFKTFKEWLLKKSQTHALLKRLLSLSFMNDFVACQDSKKPVPAPEDALLVIDMADESPYLPKNFRVCEEPFGFDKMALFKIKNKHLPSRQGMDDLKCSGSAQFSGSSLPTMLHLIKQPLMVFDLRLEPHFFNNGYAISFFCYRNDYYNSTYSDQWFETECRLLRELNDNNKDHITLNIITDKQHKRILNSEPALVDKGVLLTEENFLKEHHISYQRLPVLDGHLPHPLVVDQFLATIKTLPHDMWVHFHCRGGKGRTNTFMVMYDMYRNARHVSLDDIINRQELIGPTLVREYPEPRRSRVDMFFKNFYAYLQDDKGLNYELWSTWIQKRT